MFVGAFRLVSLRTNNESCYVSPAFVILMYIVFQVTPLTVGNSMTFIVNVMLNTTGDLADGQTFCAIVTVFYSPPFPGSQPLQVFNASQSGGCYVYMSPSSSTTNNSGFATGAIIGIVIGGFVFLLLVLVLIVLVIRRQRDRKKPPTATTEKNVPPIIIKVSCSFTIPFSIVFQNLRF